MPAGFRAIRELQRACGTSDAPPGRAGEQSYLVREVALLVSRIGDVVVWKSNGVSEL